MPWQITLDTNEEAKVKNAIPTSSNKIYYATLAIIYYAYAGTKKWSYAGLDGALVFSLNTSSNTLHFQMVDLDGAGGVIWDYELHDGLVLDQEKILTFFLSFEGDIGGDKCTIGFVFRDDSEAEIFYNHVKSNKDTTSDPSWTALFEDLDGQFGNHEMEFIKDFIRNYSEPQLKQPVGSPRPKPLPMGSPRTRSHNGASTIPHSRRTARTRPQPVVPNIRPMRPVIADDKFPLPTHTPSPQPVRSILSQHHGDLPLLREMELKQTREEIRYSHPRYSKTPPSPVLVSHSISYPTSPTTVASHSASSTSNTGTLIRRQESDRSQHVDPPAPTLEAVHEDKAESLTPDVNQTAQLPSQSSQQILGNLEGQLGKEVVADNTDFIKPRPTPPLPPRTRSQNGAPIPPPSRPAPRTQPPPVTPNMPISTVIDDEQSRPPPLQINHQSKTPTESSPAPPASAPPLLRIRNSIQKPNPRARKDNLTYASPSPRIVEHDAFAANAKSISPSIVVSRSASSTISAGTRIQRQESHRSQRVYLPSPTHEHVHEDEAESPTPDANQTTQLSSQSSQNDTAPWILASRTPHAPKTPMDDLFMACIAHIRRQTNDSDASSTGSTAPVSLIVRRISVTSSAFSQSLSVDSSPPVVEFPPTPVFKDEIPAGVMRKLTVEPPPPYSSTSRGFADRS